jgi:hypothetical protein
MDCPFDLLNKRQIIEFDEVDPYNQKNTVHGFINRRQGKYYGSIWITEVNGKICPQLIHSAPKQHYPFKKDYDWDFPEYDKIELYEKIDGTCIIAYTYKDSIGRRYLTYKTRLRPFLGSSKFGNFYSMWNEMREKYPMIDKYCNNRKYNLVFELYGKRNKVLIDYPESLHTKLIFGVRRKDGVIIPPSDLKLIGVPILDGWEEDMTSIEEDYVSWEEYLENELEVDKEEQTMVGKEGLVWYFLNENREAVQIKCKPKSVKEIHWKGDAIPFESVYTTIINAFENFDEPTYDDVVSLLLEEYTEGKISKSRVRIEKILSKVIFDKKYQHKLAEDYNKLGVNINEDKATVMRWFGKNYPKKEAKRIYNLLKQYEDG